MVKNKDMQFCTENLKMKRKRTRQILIFQSRDSNPRFTNYVGLEVWISAHDLNFQGDKNKSDRPSKIFPTLRNCLNKMLDPIKIWVFGCPFWTFLECLEIITLIMTRGRLLLGRGKYFSPKEQFHTGISCQNLSHSTIIPPWRVFWVSTEVDKLKEL